MSLHTSRQAILEVLCGIAPDVEFAGRSRQRAPDRRKVLSRLAAAGLVAGASVAALIGSTSAQLAAGVKPALIDIHHPVIPPFYLAQNRGGSPAHAEGKSVLNGSRQSGGETRWRCCLG